MVYRSNNNANANGGVSYANANNDSANVNANIGSRLANNYNVLSQRNFGVQRWGRVLDVVPMGMSLSKSVSWSRKTEKYNVGWSLVGAAMSAE